MCLYSKQILPRRATKDIICYKAMYKNIRSTGIVYVSPYKGFIIPATEFGKVYNARGDYKEYYRQRIFSCGKYCFIARIGKGYFHAYKFDHDAVIATGFTGILGPDKRVIKCIIPKGALYWNGTAADICATEMIFVEEMYVR